MPIGREATPDDVGESRRVPAASVRGLATERNDADQIESWSDVEEDDFSLPAEGSHVVVAETGGDGPTNAGAEDGSNGADAEGTIVGFGAVDFDSREVRAVYVHPDHAGRGVGSAILRELEERAASEGMEELRLTASLTAVPFYERHGWKSTERTTHQLGDDVELQARTMAKSLDGSQAVSDRRGVFSTPGGSRRSCRRQLDRESTSPYGPIRVEPEVRELPQPLRFLARVAADPELADPRQPRPV